MSDQGDVRNSKTGRILKPLLTNGYHHVVLCDANGHHRKSVHHLVADGFIANEHKLKHAYRIGLQKPIRSQIEYSLSRARKARMRPVRNIETGKRYDSIAECARNEHLRSSAVSFHLAGKAKKRRFEYADEGSVYNGDKT